MTPTDEANVEDEGLQLCPACNTPVGLHARFCEACGQALDTAVKRSARPVAETKEVSADDPRFARYLEEFETRETQRIVRELLKRNVVLINRYQKRARGLLADIDNEKRELESLSGGRATPDRSKRVQDTLERLEEIGEAWEDLQHQYNRESEELDEEFLDRLAEIEVDVEVPEVLQGRIAGMHEAMVADIDRIEERLMALGREGNELIAQAEGRYFGEGSRGRFGLTELVLWPFAIATSFAVLVMNQVPVDLAVIAASPLALVFVFFLIYYWKRG